MQDPSETSFDAEKKSPMNGDIPRRKRIQTAKRRADFTADVSYGLTRPTVGSVIGRLFVWGTALSRFTLAIVGDWIRRRNSRKQSAVRFRIMLQKLGGAGIKIGQQLGLRADIIPIEYCDELMKLLD